MPMDIIHFKELLFEVAAIIYIESNINGKLNQYKGDIWLKTKSPEESIDKG
jgi:hypothetical protein